MHLLFFNLSLALALVVTPQEVIVSTQDGKTVSGELIRLTDDELLIDNQTLELEIVQEIRFRSKQPMATDRTSEIYLVDGTILQAKKWKIVEQNLFATMHCGLNASINRRNIQAIKTKAQAKTLEKQWQETAQKSPAGGDAVILLRDGQYETLEGQIKSVENDRVRFKLDDQTADVKLERLEGLVFYHAAGRILAEPACLVTLVDGSTIQARGLELRSEKLTTTSTAGSEFAVSLDTVTSLNFGFGKTVYLSDIPASSSEWSPILTHRRVAKLLKDLNAPRIDETFDGEKLTLLIRNEGGDPTLQTFRKGFAIKSGAKIAFPLEKKFARLTGWVGFSPDASASGLARVRIRADSRTLFDKVLENNESLAATKLDVSITDAERLVIDVQPHDGRTVGDIFYFADLKVVR